MSHSSKSDSIAENHISPEYMFSGNKLRQEWERLDSQHAGFSRYLKGRLTLAPLENPTKILDMGAGNGAWAAQAAELYPEADVLAVDMSPLPPGELPPNMRFEKLDLLSEFPWKAETFDVIHLRLVLYHIPHAAQFLSRVFPLLKPNGYLILEDCCLMIFPRACGPAQLKRNEITAAFMRSKGLDPEIGARLEQILTGSDVFSDVSVRQENLCFSPLTEDPEVRPLAETMRNSVIRTTVHSPSAALVAAGMTEELRREWEKEMNDLQYDPTHRFFFVWGRKKGNSGV